MKALQLLETLRNDYIHGELTSDIEEAIKELEDLETKEESTKRQSFQPYVNETVEPCESYLVFCENHSPWDEEEKNMVRVHSNAESHKMLEILEKHFGIKNLHKKEHNEPK